MKIFTIFAVMLLAACTTKTPELKSPCVGIEGSPCEHLRPLLNPQEKA